MKKAQTRVDNLTQSILAKAFRGELVPQDPNDEPADKLLERIAVVRKEAEAFAKATKKAQSTKSIAKKKNGQKRITFKLNFIVLIKGLVPLFKNIKNCSALINFY